MADCLNKGELARAMIAAVFLRLPDLDQDGAEGVAKIAALASRVGPQTENSKKWSQFSYER